jgi:hypothetical protein
VRYIRGISYREPKEKKKKGYFCAYSTSKSLREFAVKYKIEFGKENVSQVVMKHYAMNSYERVEVLFHACLPSALRFS